MSHMPFLAPFLVMPVLAAAAHAQQVPAPATPPPPGASKGCFLPRPEAKCTGFFVTEFGFMGAVAGGGSASSEPAVFWELGYMRNTSAQESIGGSILLGVGFDRLRVGAKARYRYWIAEGVPLDLAPGVYYYRPFDQSSPDPGIGLTSHAGVSLFDVVGGFVQVDYFEGRQGYRMETLYGLRVGGIVGGVAAVAVPFVVIAAMANWDA